MKTHDTLLGAVIFVVLCIGCGLLPFLFFGFLFWGLLGISFLILDGIVMIAIRRKASAFKRTNPELYEKMRAESKKRAQEMRAREIRLSDFPPWLIALLTIAVAVGFMGEIGLFRFNGFLETLLSVLMVLFLVYYFLYKRKIINKKKRDSNMGQNSLTVSQLSTG
jgi:hypothetical protein